MTRSLVAEPPRLEVFALAARAGRPSCAGVAEAADQVGDRVAILPHGQPRQLDPGRLVAGLGTFE